MASFIFGHTFYLVVHSIAIQICNRLVFLCLALIESIFVGKRSQTDWLLFHANWPRQMIRMCFWWLRIPWKRLTIQFRCSMILCFWQRSQQTNDFPSMLWPMMKTNFISFAQRSKELSILSVTTKNAIILIFKFSSKNKFAKISATCVGSHAFCFSFFVLFFFFRLALEIKAMKRIENEEKSKKKDKKKRVLCRSTKRWKILFDSRIESRTKIKR